MTTSKKRYIVKRSNSFARPSKAVSERMKRVKSRGTGLEKAMEKILKSAKLKYEKQPKLVGCPDFRIKDTRILIFCDSSFWHGRNPEEVSGRAFKKNRPLWVRKLTETIKRDRKTNRILRKEGWSVYRFWDEDILTRPDYVINGLRRAVNESRRG